MNSQRAAPSVLTATAVSWLLCGAGQAAIVRSTSTATLGPSINTVKIDVDADGVGDFSLTLGGSVATGYTVSFLGVTSSITHVTTRIFEGSQTGVDRFHQNDVIISSGTTSANTHFPVRGDSVADVFGVQLYNGSLGYFSLAYNPSLDSFRVADLTYDSQPNASLTVAVPEPTSIAAMAIGAVGVMLRRRTPAPR